MILDKKKFLFDIKEVHFSDYPYDIEGCDFLEFYFCKNNINAKGFTRQKNLTLIIDLTQSLNTIWQNFHKTTGRLIHKGQRKGIEIRINEGYNQFFQIYRSFIQKKGIKSIFDVFGVGSTTLETIKKHGTVFVAEYEGESLVGTVYLEDDSNIEAWIGASKRLEVDKEKAKIISYANRLLRWEVIKYAKEKGIKEYNFGGLWPEEKANTDKVKDGINFFKLSFGGEKVIHYNYYKNYSKFYNIAYNIYVKKILDKVCK